VAVRDPMGIRPLCLGILPGSKEAHVLASEPTAFDLIGAEYVRDVEPGEMIVIDASGMRTMRPLPAEQPHACVFEHVYFARPDSQLAGRSVYDVRKALGQLLAREHPIDADVVIPVPDSGVPAAIGYASERKIPFEMGLIRSHYVGRTFIEPQQSIRHFGVRLKLNPVENVLKGKRVVVIDDSIVRGTTSRKIVKMVREAGAKEVHFRSASPPIKHPDFYGIDMPQQADLMAAQMTLEEMRKSLEVDSLGFLSVDGLYWAMGENARDAKNPQFTDHAFTGDYPTPLLDHSNERSGRDLQLSLLADKAAE
jgi:amidophosphoribosyltransferase